MSGTLVRIFHLGRERRDFSGASAALFLDRVFATLMLLITAIVFWFLQSPFPNVVWILVFCSCCAALWFLMWLLFHEQLAASLGRYFSKHRITRFLGSVHLAIRKFAGIPSGVFVSALLQSALAHGAGVLAYWAIIESLSIDLNLSAVGWVRSVMLVVTLVPLSFAGIGIREAGAYMAFSLYGLDPSVAVTFSVLVFAVSVLGIGIIGGIVESARVLSVKAGAD